MLVNLKINNIALIEKLNIDFNSGLTVLTGETGAGKSIIIDAINFVLGERADKNLIRTGQTFAKVDAVFCFESNFEKIKNVFENLGIEFENTIILSRTMSFEGKNECRVNGQLVTVGMLKQISNTLIDIHGQQEHQVIMNPKNYIEILDTYIGSDLLKLKSSLSSLLSSLKDINNKISSLGGSDADREAKMEYLQFQFNELKKANLSCGEEEKLAEQLKILNSAEKIKTSITDCIMFLDTNSVNANYCLNISQQKLNSISAYKPEYENILQRIISLRLELEDCVQELKNELNDLDFNESEYNKIDSRLDEIRNLKRKFSKTESQLIEYTNQLAEEINMLSSSEELLLSLKNQKHQVIQQLKDIAYEISNKRKKHAVDLENQIKHQLIQLGMPSAIFKIEFLNNANDDFEKSISFNGIDNIEFMFSANLGQPLKPISKVISGGEMSRFMLSFKTVISKIDSINTLIFDEIDTGISGNIAHIVAQKMAKIAKHRQVICISHLPQISAMADNHFLIRKYETENQTKTELKLLESSERINEISRLLGGVQNSQVGKSAAIELLEECENFKNSKI